MIELPNRTVVSVAVLRAARSRRRTPLVPPATPLTRSALSGTQARRGYTVWDVTINRPCKMPLSIASLAADRRHRLDLNRLPSRVFGDVWTARALHDEPTAHS